MNEEKFSIFQDYFIHMNTKQADMCDSHMFSAAATVNTLISKAHEVIMRQV
jgi:hypothetical protein